MKIYQADERYAQKMDEEAERFRRVTMRVLIMQLNSISVMDLVAYGGAACGIILGILELRAGNISFAECFFITMISAVIFLPLRLLGSFFHIAMNGNAAADKIFGLLDEPEPVNGMVTEVKGSDIVFCGVGFGYDENEPVFSDVSFAIPERSFAALVGASGCGKSTIASLLMGSSRGYTGSITIGGVELRRLRRKHFTGRLHASPMRAICLRVQSWKISRWESRTPGFPRWRRLCGGWSFMIP